MDERMNAIIERLRQISGHLVEIGALCDECDELGLHIIGVSPVRTVSYNQRSRIQVNNGITELFTATDGKGIVETPRHNYEDGGFYPGDVSFDMDGVEMLQLRENDGTLRGMGE